jgi:hypothetical protein
MLSIGGEMNKLAIAFRICLLLAIAVSCGEQAEREPEDAAQAEVQVDPERTAAAYTEMNEYVNSYDYSIMWLDYTTDNGETDYQALYAAVADRCERIAGNHGFESLDQWLEAIERYREDEMVASARAGYGNLADDVLGELRDYGEHGYHDDVPDDFEEFDEEQPTGGK